MGEYRLHFPQDLSRDNFPGKDNLVNLLYNIKFNNLLTNIKNKILDANNINLNYIKLTPNDLHNNTEELIDDLLNFLKTKKYTITNIEDDNNVNLGYKIKW
jgi:hypothetical protein